MVEVNDILTVVSDAVKLCKEKEFVILEELLHKSYIELINVEAQARRQKASSIIKALQLLDKEMFMLNNEYNKIIKKFNMEPILAIDIYIEEIKKHRRKLVREKNSLR